MNFFFDARIYLHNFKTVVDILLPLWTGVDILFPLACIISHPVDSRFVFLRFPRAPVFSQEIWGSTVSILCQCISHQAKKLDLKKYLFTLEILSITSQRQSPILL